MASESIPQVFQNISRAIAHDQEGARLTLAQFIDEYKLRFEDLNSQIPDTPENDTMRLKVLEGNRAALESLHGIFEAALTAPDKKKSRPEDDPNDNRYILPRRGEIVEHPARSKPQKSERLSMADQEIFDKVRDTIVDALGVDEDEVTPTATLIGDLGAESIDLLDINYRLERNFPIKIQRGELFPEDLTLADRSFVRDGIVTLEGFKELRKRMPHAVMTILENDPRVQNISEIFTVQMIVNYLKSKGV